MEYLSHSPEETEHIGEELGRTLQLRYTPELQFTADDSIEYGAHILEMLRDPTKVWAWARLRSPAGWPEDWAAADV